MQVSPLLLEAASRDSEDSLRKMNTSNDGLSGGWNQPTSVYARSGVTTKSLLRSVMSPPTYYGKPRLAKDTSRPFEQDDLGVFE